MKEETIIIFDVKGDEVIFLGYSCKNKAYKCLNLATHKFIESVHIKIYEFAKRNEEHSNKEPEDYIKFVYYELSTIPKSQALVIGHQPCQPPNSSIQPLLPPVPLMQPKL